MKANTQSSKKLILGTAMWGWGISRNTAYDILDKFLLNGGIFVDTATNYPINKYNEDYGLAIRWLTEWQQINQNTKLSLIVKIGSINNMGGPENDLSQRNIFETTKRLRDLFELALSCVSIHWDDRKNDDADQNAIAETVAAMAKIHEEGLDIGLSGIKNPEYYYLSNPSLAKHWIIQVKENLITSATRLSYQKFFPDAKYLAYGINMGGIKIGEYSSDSSVNLRKIKIETTLLDKVRTILESDHGISPCPKSFNELSLAFGHSNASLAGVIIGPRSVSQLEETLNYWSDLENVGSSSAWSKVFSELSSKD